jgi:hypothetical protein
MNPTPDSSTPEDSTFDYVEDSTDTSIDNDINNIPYPSGPSQPEGDTSGATPDSSGSDSSSEFDTSAVVEMAA